jgi:hypothetical protein
MEQVLLDLAAGIRHLRGLGFDHIVLVDNSGGAAACSASARMSIRG